MRGYLYVAIILLPALIVAQVTIDGYAYLENQSEHSGIQVLFERTAPSSLTYTVYTDTDGYYTNEIETGIYDVTYSKDGYFFQSLSDQILYNNTTLDDITLSTQANIIYVPEDYTTIQEALNVADEGNTILVAAGTYVENINFNGKNIFWGYPTHPDLGIPPCLYVICHAHTKQVKRFVDWTKGGFGGKLGSNERLSIWSYYFIACVKCSSSYCRWLRLP